MTQNTLKHIPLSGYQSIHNLDLELKALNVLIGANGAGKSKFIAAHTGLVYHFADTARIKQPGKINDNAALHPDGSNLAAFLYRLQNTETQAYRKIMAAVRNIAPFFDTFVLGPDPLDQESIRLEWQEKGAGGSLRIAQLSAGILRFIAIATLLLQPNPPATILLDEPELSLHPYALTLLASLLRKAANRSQVIIATQSVPLVNQFSAQDIIVVERSQRQSTFRRLEPDQLAPWLADYGVGDLWEKNVSGGRP